MSEQDRTLRRIRQALLTDRLLGADAVPLTGRPAPWPGPKASTAPPAVSPGPSLPSPAADPQEQPVLFDRPNPPEPAPMSASTLTPDEKQRLLDEIDRKQVRGCTRCGLCQGRTNTVFGQGNPDADLMFIGEGPGADEDAQGLPFVGRAGQLLNKQIQAMGLTREQVYIANTVKCRPPGNRNPTPAEARTCMNLYLYRQVEIIQPKVIVALGGIAAKFLLDEPQLAITRQRGQWRKFGQIDLMPTFHPAYLLRNYTPDARRKVWDDLQKVMQRLGL